MELSSVRVLILGASGSGKTALLQRIRCPSAARAGAEGVPLNAGTGAARAGAPASSSTTVGCETAVVVHRGGTSSSSTSSSSAVSLIELLEVGGSPDARHARQVYYDGVDGIIVVCDASSEADLSVAEGFLSEFAAHLRKREEEARARGAAGGRGEPQGGRGGGGGGSAAAAAAAAARDGGMRHRGGGDPDSSSSSSSSSQVLLTPLPLAVARMIQDLPVLIIAAKADAAGSLVQSVVDTVVSGPKNQRGAGGQSPSPSALRRAADAWERVVAGVLGRAPRLASPLERALPAGTVTRAKLRVAIPTDTTSAIYLCGCRLRSPKTHVVTVTAPIAWTVRGGRRGCAASPPPREM
jgi:GTPase SAR1 family protein